MASRRQTIAVIAVGAAAAAAGMVLGPLIRPVPEAIDAGPLFALPLHDLSGQPRSLFEWKGSVLICNFWATWCAPCREEIPALGRVRQKMASKRVEIVGIAIDSASNVSQFVKELSIPYPVVLADMGAIELMRRLGNSAGGLPFTLILDRNGKIADSKLGSLAEAELEKKLAPIV